jgi:Formamidopyrimidine-DNA glycosylase
MTGKLFIFNQSSKKLLKTSFYYENKIDKKHNHLIFKFNRNISLIYNDVRKFGFIKLISLRNFKKNNHLIHLGPEPLNKEFNIIYLMKKIRNIKKNVKNFLMDQKNVAGLGNIYVNEILHTSSINPRKISKNLKLDEIKKIIKNTKIILKKAIFLGGSSIRDFKGISGNTGNFQQKFKVYGRDGQLCRKSGCKGIIKKIYISNRSTFHCIRCQK